MPVLTDPLGWFTVVVPEGWEVSTEDCVTTLTNPARTGIVYISGARHARGQQQSFGRADFLARFLRSLGLAVEDEEIRDGIGTGCRVFSYRRDTDRAQWRFWSVTDDETALLISYGSTAPDPVEAEAIDELVESVRLFHSAVH